MTYRVYVYRTNELGEELAYCISRAFLSEKQALDFQARQNRKPRRKAVLSIY